MSGKVEGIHGKGRHREREKRRRRRRRRRRTGRRRSLAAWLNTAKVISKTSTTTDRETWKNTIA